MWLYRVTIIAVKQGDAAQARSESASNQLVVRLTVPLIMALRVRDLFLVAKYTIVIDSCHSCFYLCALLLVKEIYITTAS
jgi:hypothetical protein